MHRRIGQPRLGVSSALPVALIPQRGELGDRQLTSIPTLPGYPQAGRPGWTLTGWVVSIRSVWREVARYQSGVLTTAQAVAGGLTPGAIRAKVRAGRWQRVYPGVYATFTGPLPRRSQLWAAALKAGDGALLSHETAAELVGLTDGPGRAVHVTVPAGRSDVRVPGVVVHRSRRAAVIGHPTRTPPQTRVEETVLDLAQSARHRNDALGWVTRAIGARLTTSDRLLASMRARQRMRWRRPLHAAIGDAGDGCHSLLELLHLRKVERAHGLPRGDRQVRRDGVRRYDDVKYKKYRTRVELDGQAAHPDHARWRDRRRDNAATVEGDRNLRYGLGDVDEYPCAVAAEVAEVLHQEGWPGNPNRAADQGAYSHSVGIGRSDRSPRSPR